MKEKWKRVPNFDGYKISNLGGIQSCRFGTGGGLVFKYWRPIKLKFNGRKSHRQVTLVDRQGIRRTFGLHRLLYELFVGPIPDGMQIDHIDRNGLNNSLDNLRLSNQQQNTCNRSLWKGRKHRGVRKEKSGRYSCQTSSNGKMVYLGRFDTEDQAAEAYNKYAIATYGEFAALNVLEKEIN